MEMSSPRLQTLEMLSKVLEKYQWLLNAFNLDYFEENHWEKMPESWRLSLDSFRQSDIPQLLPFGDTTKRPPLKTVFPLAILSLRSLSQSMRQMRAMAKDWRLPALFGGAEEEGEAEDSATAHPLELSFSAEHQFPVKPLKVSDQILCRRVKLKKRHEIERLCRVIPQLMRRAGDLCQVIDCGSGQGHLDRILSIVYGYRVVSVESDCDNVNGALDTDEMVRRALKKSRLADLPAERLPTKVNAFLSEKEDIGEQVKRKKGKEDGEEGTDTEEKHLLLGLHACGALSNLVLEQFVNDPAASALVLATCCYMKAGGGCFPMSRFLQEERRVNFTLTRVGKELACHAIEKFIGKFERNEINSLKVHGYRSILELLVSRFDPEKRHQGMRSVKIDSDMNFEEYARRATRDLKVNIPPEALADPVLVGPCLRQLERPVVFYAVRQLVAPLVELLLLLDFEQYLAEHDQVAATYLVPLFEPTLSPRNLILLAHK